MELTSILIYLIIVLATVSVYLLKRNLRYWKTQGIPHEEPHFIMGSIHGMRSTKHIGLIIADYYRKFQGSGPFAGFYVMQRAGVVLLEKDVIKQVLIKDFSNFADRGIYYNEKNDPLTGHLFFMDGQKWRTLRNKLSHAFTTSKMKFMFPIVLNVTDQFMQVLNETVKENAVVEVRELLARYTTDIIGSCAFGIECNSLKDPTSEFLILGRKALEEQRHNALIMAFTDGFPKLARKLGMRILPEDVHNFFMNTTKDTIAYREKNNIQRNDFLNILMDLKNDKTGLGGLTIEEMCAQVFVFFVGGFETSSTAMAYALYELAQHQDLQDRLREEVNEVFENANAKETGITYDTLKNLAYLEQVVAETLRKYPILPMLTRECLSDYIVPGHPKYVIKKGMPVFIPVLGIQHDPELYSKPEVFDPERFSPEMVKQRDAIEWLGFGDGPRHCIGMHFAKMQSRLGLASIIQRFRFTVCPKTEIPLTYDPKNFVLVPKNSVYLNVEAI